MDERTLAVRREYAALARDYDARWGRYVAASARETIRRVGALERERVLDLGCGTGFLLDELSARAPGARLVGLDLSAEMLGVARERLGERAALVVGQAAALPFRDASFELVLTANAFHFVTRPSRALQELRRVLRPGGRVVLTDWCDDYIACKLCDRLLRIARRSHHRIYGATACGRMLEEAGFEAVAVERYKIDWLWGLMTATARRPAVSAAAASAGAPRGPGRSPV